MSRITFKGDPVTTSGELPGGGTSAPDFTLTATDLTEFSKSDFTCQRMVLNVFPSLDTSVCANTVRQFNQRAAGFENTVVLCISMDLPFAQERFCGAEGITNVRTLSAFRNRDFGDNYGLRIVDGPLRDLLARAVLVIDEDGKVAYTELAPEIAQEPDYEAALAAL